MKKQKDVLRHLPKLLKIQIMDITLIGMSRNSKEN